MEPHQALAAQEEGDHDREADALAEQRRKRRSRDTQSEGENKNGVQRDIQQPSGHKAAHREGGVTLRTKDIVHYERGAHHRRAEQYPACVASRVGQYRRRRTEQPHQAVDKNQPASAEEHPHNDRAEKRGRAVDARRFTVSRAEHARDHAAGTHAEGEADRLEDRHQRKDDSDRAARAGAELGDEIGVCGVVKRRDQHADYRRNGERNNERPDRSLRHARMMLR